MASKKSVLQVLQKAMLTTASKNAGRPCFDGLELRECIYVCPCPRPGREEHIAVYKNPWGPEEGWNHLDGEEEYVVPLILQNLGLPQQNLHYIPSLFFKFLDESVKI